MTDGFVDVPAEKGKTKTCPSIAVYPGTFDPITNGHIDIVKRAFSLFDKVIVVVAMHPGKKALFDVKERLQMIRDCFPPDENRVEVEEVRGLLVDFAHQKKASIIRGLRAVSDFEYEFQLALMNRKLQRDVETVFLMTGFRWIFISSSIIKDAARHGGDISGLVPKHVQRKLAEKFSTS